MYSSIFCPDTSLIPLPFAHNGSIVGALAVVILQVCILSRYLPACNPSLPVPYNLLDTHLPDGDLFNSLYLRLVL